MINKAGLPSLIIVGRSGTGKTTIASGLSSKTGRPVIEIGHYVRMDAKASGRTPLEEAQNTFNAHRYLHYVQRAVADAKLIGLPCIVVGPRMPVELSFLKKELRPVFSVSLTTSEPLRRTRIEEREMTLSAQNVSDRRRDAVEQGWGLKASMSNCDASISVDVDPESAMADLLELWAAKMGRI